MAFSRLVRNLVRDPRSASASCRSSPTRRVPSAWTAFKEVGIYNPLGQRYTPVDEELLLVVPREGRRPAARGGHHRGGLDVVVPGRRHRVRDLVGADGAVLHVLFDVRLQRTGDQVWAFGDARGRGFMMGATAGRTTLTGEGLQHDDGQWHLLASTIPNVLAYDPAFASSWRIVREGIDRMYGERGEDVFYYITIYNENWTQPAKAEGVEDGVLRGLYRFREAPAAHAGSRSSRRADHAAGARAQEMLAEKYDVAADVWSATSVQQLRNEALDVERWNRLHPDQEQRVAVRAASASGRRPDRSSPPPTR